MTHQLPLMGYELIAACAAVRLQMIMTESQLPLICHLGYNTTGCILEKASVETVPRHQSMHCATPRDVYTRIRCTYEFLDLRYACM